MYYMYFEMTREIDILFLFLKMRVLRC